MHYACWYVRAMNVGMNNQIFCIESAIARGHYIFSSGERGAPERDGYFDGRY